MTPRTSTLLLGVILLTGLAPAYAGAQEAGAEAGGSPEASVAVVPVFAQPEPDEAATPIRRGPVRLQLRLGMLRPSRLDARGDVPAPARRRLLRGRRLVIAGSTMMAIGAVAMGGAVIGIEANRTDCDAVEGYCLDLTEFAYMSALGVIAPVALTGTIVFVRGQVQRRRGEQALQLGVAFTPQSATLSMRF